MFRLSIKNCSTLLISAHLSTHFTQNCSFLLISTHLTQHCSFLLICLLIFTQNYSFLLICLLILLKIAHFYSFYSLLIFAHFYSKLLISAHSSAHFTQNCSFLLIPSAHSLFFNQNYSDINGGTSMFITRMFTMVQSE